MINWSVEKEHETLIRKFNSLLDDYSREHNNAPITSETIIGLGFIKNGSIYRLGPLVVRMYSNKAPEWVVDYDKEEYIPGSIAPRDVGELMKLLDRLNLVIDGDDS